METNKTKIKVCGLKHPLEVKCAADYGANWYGMIFEKDSPRFINYKQAEVLLNSTPELYRAYSSNSKSFLFKSSRSL